MYSKEAGEGAKLDPDTFLKYREAALQRQEISRRLNLSSLPDDGSTPALHDIISLYDFRKAA